MAEIPELSTHMLGTYVFTPATLSFSDSIRKQLPFLSSLSRAKAKPIKAFKSVFTDFNKLWMVPYSFQSFLSLLCCPAAA